MDIRIAAFAISALLIASTAMSPVFAQDDGVNVATDNDSYESGSQIMVSGTVSAVTGHGLVLQVVSPNGNIVGASQAMVEDDGSFATMLTAGGPLWVDGDYTIKVTYGDRSTSTMFAFTGPMVEPEPQELMVMIDEHEFSLPYEAGMSSVNDLTVNMQDKSVVLSIDAVEDGDIVITLPRELIDSTGADGTDTGFIVLVDGEETAVIEEADDETRTLTIPVLFGAQEIEIIGTMVIPEFGTIALLILAAAIVSIIAVSSRSRLSILPKY